MKILYIGEAKTRRLYEDGLVPSHWLYGAIEMEKDGHKVIWTQESTQVLNDLTLIRKNKPDIIFIPNLNIKSHLLLLLFVWFHIIRIPVYAYLHHSPKNGEGLKSWVYKHSLNSLGHIFFLSELSMKETIDRGFITGDKCSVPGWGADREFYDSVKTSDNGYFVSTGKENRDFDILIEAFRRTGAPLKIMTAKSHAGNDYSDLENRCKDIPNIEVVLTENSSNVFPVMLEAMAQAKALVCPLRQDRLDYCVGLSTIADAEGLRKPLIITRNPYHTTERVRKFEVALTIEDWIRAIHYLWRQYKQETKIRDKSEYFESMSYAYFNMKKYMRL